MLTEMFDLIKSLKSAKLTLIKNWLVDVFSWPLLITLVTLITRAINVFGYPEYLGDEGIYVAQAWWLSNFGEISPYTYWYDHSPFGWLQVGFWQKLTGGPFTFGFSVNSGRVFMIIISAITAWLLWQICRKTAGKKAAIIALTLFIFSPLAIIYQRQLLLDNLAVVWFLLAIYLLLKAEKRLLYFLLSGLALGLALLSKEVVLFLIPGFFWLVFKKSRGQARLFLILAWLISLAFATALYPLLAYLKLELLPANWLPGSQEHVSLLESFLFQGGRKGGSLFNPESDIRKAIVNWFNVDKLLPILGIWATFFLLADIKDSFKQSLLLMSLGFAFYLFRGGVVLGFYLIPQIALWTIIFAQIIQQIQQKINLSLAAKWYYYFATALAVILITSAPYVYSKNKNATHHQALSYLRANIDSKAVIAIDPLFYTDLKIAPDYPKFQNVEWISKIEKDPQIRYGKLNNRWQRIDYSLITAGAAGEIEKNNYEFIKKAINESKTIKVFENGSTTISSRIYQLPAEAKLSPLGKVSQTPPTLLEKMKRLIITPQENYNSRLILTTANLNKISNSTITFIDQEGGSASRITESPNIAQSQIKDKNEAFRVAKVRGIMLKRAGIDINLAPVLDIAYNPTSYIAKSNRSFGDKNKAINYGRAMIKGYQQGGVKTIIKHFPGGLGRTQVDPHWSLPTISISRQQLKEDIAPFVELADRTDGIMVTHLFYPQIDNQYPSSLSPIFINSLLRQDLDYQGPVILDDLAMGALAGYGQTESIKLGLEAGADLFIVSQPEKNLLEKLEKQIESGEINPELVERAWQRSKRLLL